MKTDMAITENSVEITLKLGINLQYDPAIPLLGIYPEKIIILKDNVP